MALKSKRREEGGRTASSERRESLFRCETVESSIRIDSTTQAGRKKLDNETGRGPAPIEEAPHTQQKRNCT